MTISQCKDCFFCGKYIYLNDSKGEQIKCCLNCYRSYCHLDFNFDYGDDKLYLYSHDKMVIYKITSIDDNEETRQKLLKFLYACGYKDAIILTKDQMIDKAITSDDNILFECASNDTLESKLLWKTSKTVYDLKRELEEVKGLVNDLMNLFRLTNINGSLTHRLNQKE